VIGLFDRDVFLKLCCCNLWFEAVEALGVTQPYRLQSTSSERANRRKITQMLKNVDPDEAVQRARAVVATVPALTDELIEAIYASEGYKVLSNVEGIDGGEHVLAAILINEPEGRVLLSGDKRFVDAFRTQRPEQWEVVSNAVISFEMCMLAIEVVYGFDYVLERAMPMKHCDGTLKLAIGDEPTAEAFREALKSFNPCRAVPDSVN
jgi:hypothetical protein